MEHQNIIENKNINKNIRVQDDELSYIVGGKGYSDMGLDKLTKELQKKQKDLRSAKRKSTALSILPIFLFNKINPYKKKIDQMTNDIEEITSAISQITHRAQNPDMWD